MQLTTAAERSVTLLTFMVISIVSPVDFTSVAKGLYPMVAFAPFTSFSALPVQPLLLQSTFSNVVLTPPASHTAGSLSSLLRPAASSLNSSP